MDINSASRAISEATEGQGSVTNASALSAQERIFCDVFVGNGGKAGEAARAAGYADKSADVTACKLLCRPRVADRIKDLCGRFAHSALPVAIQTLISAASDEKALWKDRIKAANSLIEMAGLMPTAPGTQVNVAVQMNGQQAQSIIASVHAARSARLSDIPPAMSDTMEADFETLEQLAIGPPPAPPGGDQLQGPGAGLVPLPVYPPEQCDNPGVSDDDPAAEFRKAFDDDEE